MSLFFGLSMILTGIILIIVLTSWLKINAFLSLFLVSLLLAIIVLPFPEVVPALKKGFGDTMASIGLIIIFGAVIGVTLDVTGATMSMANFILNKTGRSNAPVAIGLTGFITGLPIFCDSGFIVLSGLNRSLTMKSLSNPVLMASTLACSLYSVHCLIPPHPGATAAAGMIGANIGKLVLLGIAVAIPSAASGYFWSRLLSRKCRLQSIPEPPSLKEESAVKRLPPPGRSFVPVLVPLLLITLKSLSEYLFPGGNSIPVRLMGLLGDPVIALLIGMLLSFRLFPALSGKEINQVLTTSIEKAGPIIIITAAGGIFGAVLRSTGIGEQAGAFLSGTGLGLLIPFLIAAVLKTAQGSSTVAIITTASIMSTMLNDLGFSGEYGKMLVMLAMGAGSMVFSHANDSYFWVITNFSKLDANDTLKVYSTATVIMGVTAMGMVLLLSLMKI